MQWLKYNKNKLLIFLHVFLLYKEDFWAKLLQSYIDKFPDILF